MGLEDIVNQAKDLVSSTGAGDQVDGVVDQAAEAVKEKTPDQVDGLVDQGAQAIKDQI
jgi:hypothetical protein